MQESGATSGKDTARVFVALRPDLAVRAALTAYAGDWHWPHKAVRYAQADWHLTLHFIGPLPREQLAALRAVLDTPLEPFELRFGEPALWPKGLAVLLPLAVPPALQALHDHLGQRLRQIGLPTAERAYLPHLTLARHAAAARAPARFPAWGWRVDGYALMESTGDATQRYRVLQQYGPSADADGAVLV